MVETPVLYITFARPEYASKSFAAIRNAKPKKLYFYSNKARDEKPDEVARNKEVRSFVEQIDWDCEVITWFREEHVDVFTSLWGAIDWVFAKEERAIIIEEDVVTSLAFFDYVDKLIGKYENNENVWIISGNNACPEYSPNNLSYFPTRFPDIYGWASWKNRWDKLDKKLTMWPEYKKSKEFKAYYDGLLQRKLYSYYYSQVYNAIDHYNPWDFIFTCNMAYNKGYSIMPYVNLNMDIGVVGANHQQGIDSPLMHIGIKEEYFDTTKGPDAIIPTSFDKKFFVKNRLCGMLKRKIKKIFHI